MLPCCGIQNVQSICVAAGQVALLKLYSYAECMVHVCSMTPNIEPTVSVNQKVSMYIYICNDSDVVMWFTLMAKDDLGTIEADVLMGMV